MNRWMKAVALGVEILADVEQLLSGQGASFSFSWQGRTFNVTIAQPPAQP